MRKRLRRIGLLVVLAGLVAAARQASAGDEKALVGSYRLVKRVTKDGTELTGPTVIGMLTFTKTHRTVIMKWKGAGDEPVSISFIGTYTLSHEKFCESEIYGVNSNLGASGVTYDEPSAAPTCTGWRRTCSAIVGTRASFTRTWTAAAGSSTTASDTASATRSTSHQARARVRAGRSRPVRT